MTANLLITMCIKVNWKVKPSGHQTNYNLLIMDLNLYLELSGFTMATDAALAGRHTNVRIDQMEMDYVKRLRDIWTKPLE